MAMITDNVLRTFLTEQHTEAMALADASELFELAPCGSPPYQQYIVRFSSRGLVRRRGEVMEARRFEVGINFPPDYLRFVSPGEVVALLAPWDVFHPNVRGPLLCLGPIPPGTRLVDLIYQCYELLGYSKVTMTELDALNWEACRWARENQDRFPIEDRPLKSLASLGRRAADTRAARTGGPAR